MKQNVYIPVGLIIKLSSNANVKAYHGLVIASRIVLFDILTEPVQREHRLFIE